MKIAELISESQTTDEGVLGSIAKGAGTAIGAVGKGLGAISGAWKGAKDQFQKGQAAGRAHVGGWMPEQPKDTSVRDQEFARLTGKGGAAAAPAAAGGQAAAAPAAGGAEKAASAAASGPVDAIKTQIDQLAPADKTALMAALKGGGAKEPTPLATPPKTEPGIGQASNSNNAVATNTAPADTKVPTVGGQAAPTAPSMKPMQVPGAGTNPNPTKPAAAAPADQAAAQEPAGQPNLQVQQGGKNPALDARKAALAQSKADTAAGKGVTGAIKSGTMGESLEEGFYSKFLGQVL